MSFLNSLGTFDYLFEFFLAPINYPGILGTVGPLIIGMFVLSLFFGRDGKSDFGDADSVGNSLLWISTAVGVYMSDKVSSLNEKLMMGGLLLFGVFTLYLDFTSKRHRVFEFLTGLVGPSHAVAYIATVLVLTPISLNPQSIKAAAFFTVILSVFFELMRLVVPSRTDQGYGR